MLLWKVQMANSSLPGSSTANLESLMKAGQQSMKQFDDAIAAAMDVASVARRVRDSLRSRFFPTT
jgi:hypothetical protein